MDEPTIGLHQKDNKRLIKTLTKLRDLGNTVIVVEHDEEAIKSADFIVDIGPGAGSSGGEIVCQGSIDDIKNETKSLTGNYLKGQKKNDVQYISIQPDKIHIFIIYNANKFIL